MLIAQFTDLHAGPESDAICAGNLDRFAECLGAVKSFRRQPDLLVITGDLAEYGDETSYMRFLEVMESCGLRWTCTLGNHDDPDAFAAALGQGDHAGLERTDSLGCGNWRVVLAASHCAGLESGYFDEVSATRLDEALRQHPQSPTLLALHHPPVAFGLEWMDPDPAAEWIARLAEVLQRHPQVQQIVCGHVHLPVMTRFFGIPLAIAPSTAAQGWPDLAPFNRDCPDGRPLIARGAPSFALHRLTEKDVATIFCSARPGETLLRHDRKFE